MLSAQNSASWQRMFIYVPLNKMKSLLWAFITTPQWFNHA